MNAELLPYQQRVVDEKNQLDEKLAKLNDFLENKPAMDLFQIPGEDRLLLAAQAKIMKTYSDILRKRIIRFENTFLANDDGVFATFQCHKKVKAAKIEDIAFAIDCDSIAFLRLKNLKNELIVDMDFIKKHNPQVGGYYVIYDDGYTSFSPKEAFENGYSLSD